MSQRDSAGNVYVADTFNSIIRKVSPTGTVTLLAGNRQFGTSDGVGGKARFNDPSGLAVDSAGNVYVADQGASTIRRVTAAGLVTTLAGIALQPGSTDGVAAEAQFNAPSSVALDGADNVFVVDQNNHTIRKIAASGMVTTLAGDVTKGGVTDGTGRNVLFVQPAGVAVDRVGNVYVADSASNTIRRGFVANAAPVIVPFASSVGLNGGQFDFKIVGPAGQVVVVEVSFGLVNWQSLSTNTLGAGSLFFTDLPSPGTGHRFYRARKQ
jgi:sugar lactone lactonase YvrE